MLNSQIMSVLTLSFVICVSCIPRTGEKSGHKHQIKGGNLTIAQLNALLFDSHIAIVSDIRSNRTIVVRKGVTIDAFETISGMYKENRSMSPLGHYTIHLIDYCPPWHENELIKTSEAGCAPSNPLGAFALWFKDNHIYGFHGRPPHFDPARFFASSPGDRRESRGCIVAPPEPLRRLVLDVIFQMPGLREHERVATIRGHVEQRTKTTVSVRIQDFKGNPPIRLSEADKDIVRADVRLFIIDTGDLQFWPSLSTLELRHPILQLFRTAGAPHSHHPLRIVVDCTAKTAVPLYSQDLFHVMGVLPPGQKVMGVYLHALQPLMSEITVMQGHKKSVMDTTTLQCSSDYYWSSADTARIR